MILAIWVWFWRFRKRYSKGSRLWYGDFESAILKVLFWKWFWWFGKRDSGSRFWWFWRRDSESVTLPARRRPSLRKSSHHPRWLQSRKRHSLSQARHIVIGTTSGTVCSTSYWPFWAPFCPPCCSPSWRSLSTPSSRQRSGLWWQQWEALCGISSGKGRALNYVKLQPPPPSFFFLLFFSSSFFLNARVRKKKKVCSSATNQNQFWQTASAAPGASIFFFFPPSFFFFLSSLSLSHTLAQSVQSLS